MEFTEKLCSFHTLYLQSLDWLPAPEKYWQTKKNNEKIDLQILQLCFDFAGCNLRRLILNSLTASVSVFPETRHASVWSCVSNSSVKIGRAVILWLSWMRCGGRPLRWSVAWPSSPAIGCRALNQLPRLLDQAASVGVIAKDCKKEKQSQRRVVTYIAARIRRLPWPQTLQCTNCSERLQLGQLDLFFWTWRRFSSYQRGLGLALISSHKLKGTEEAYWNVVKIRNASPADPTQAAPPQYDLDE